MHLSTLMLTRLFSSDIGSFNYQAVGHTVFAVGRFLSALVGLLVEPRWILMFLYICLIVTSTLAMSLTGYAGVAMVVLILFFEVRLNQKLTALNQQLTVTFSQGCFLSYSPCVSEASGLIRRWARSS